VRRQPRSFKDFSSFEEREMSFSSFFKEKKASDNSKN
jgi:hypothetical protein